ncbi:MAG: metalloregulator ArsR/SmtB family transcription factor [Alphaproteobacteria bacterium]|nr:metalloregulator ArsR/SmtB family transcription factor [Alphaproteobacteria bacterium]
MNTNDAVPALAAIAQEHRLAIYRLLVQAGPEGMAAGAIADALGLPPSSLSFHLAHLNRAGMIAQRRESRSLIYTADFERMNALVGFLTDKCCGGQPCGPLAQPASPPAKRA